MNRIPVDLFFIERRTIKEFRKKFPDVLGNVAGDDTLLLVCAEGAGGAKVAARLAELAGL